MMTRELHAGGVGYLGQNSKELHFWLLAATHLDEATIVFPDGARRTLALVPAGSHTVVHPSLLGDGNGDGELDDADRGLLLACLEAANSGTTPRDCMWFDFDGDLAVTDADLAAFEEARLRRRCDLDSDGSIGARDLVILLDAWGSKGGEADLDADGVVDGGYLKILLAFWD